MKKYPQTYVVKMFHELLKLQEKYGTLENFYNISDKRLRIEIYKKNENVVQFNITFTRVPHIGLLKQKMSKYILKDVEKYAEEKINISLDVKYPNDYPFKPPQWSLSKYDDNILKENISKYYEYVIQTHNYIYSIEQQWSPAIPLRIDFLDLLLKITMGLKYTLEKRVS